MNDRFLQHIESLHPSFDALLACIPFTFSELPKQLPDAGIYLFTEGDRHLYVGRTNRLRKRLQQHCRPGSPHSSSPFAFRLDVAYAQFRFAKRALPSPIRLQFRNRLRIEENVDALS